MVVDKASLRNVYRDGMGSDRRDEVLDTWYRSYSSYNHSPTKPGTLFFIGSLKIPVTHLLAGSLKIPNTLLFIGSVKIPITFVFIGPLKISSQGFVAFWTNTCNKEAFWAY